MPPWPSPAASADSCCCARAASWKSPWRAINTGRALDANDLRVPRHVIRRALTSRRDLLSMSFDPLEEQGLRPEMTIAMLELRSVVCLPLIRIAAEHPGRHARDLRGRRHGRPALHGFAGTRPPIFRRGNRELLQTLAIEASTILENARLFEEERSKIRMEDELKIAREIQQGLQPTALPPTGWFRAAGSSIPSTQVGGDYFDVRQDLARRLGSPWWPMFPAKASVPRYWRACCKARS